MYPNTHVTAMKGQPWPQVLALMGEEGEKMMINLILDCGIFIPVESGRGNYHQLSGRSSLIFGLEKLIRRRNTTGRPRGSSANYLRHSR